MRRTLIYKFEKDPHEGKVYSMSNFGVAVNLGSYRTTKHEYKLNFQFNTKVKLCDKNGVPSDIYLIANLIDVFNSEYDTDYLVNVMSMLTGVGMQREYERNGAKTKMVAMELDYDGFKFKVTLFGQYTEELDVFVAAGEIEKVVVVVLLAKVKIWQAAHDLKKRCLYATLILKFTTILDLLIFICSDNIKMVGKNEVPSSGITILQDPSRVTDEEDFLQVTPR
ncbi:DUF223 domain protein [Medicago truncatula]|uniref:DUF223 domain protein n=1 Tax=Medicago truncatula TaxID=3880 RepID=A0A072TQL7_MEDTR|nr:DUF223 domain protein [Medicago truncatula]